MSSQKGNSIFSGESKLDRGVLARRRFSRLREWGLEERVWISFDSQYNSKYILIELMSKRLVAVITAECEIEDQNGNTQRYYLVDLYHKKIDKKSTFQLGFQDFPIQLDENVNLLFNPETTIERNGIIYELSYKEDPTADCVCLCKFSF